MHGYSVTHIVFTKFLTWHQVETYIKDINEVMNVVAESTSGGQLLTWNANLHASYEV